MRALIVYESMFGNTKAIAEAVAAGLGRDVDVELVEVGAAPTRPSTEVDLLVVGAPTHAFGMSRASTRADAASKSDEPLVSTGIGVREWIEQLPRAEWATRAATFDTRVAHPHVPGSAARGALKRLRRLGFRGAGRATSFYVDGTTGPLVAGELDRAKAWGHGLAVESGLAA
jgi:hypothetical protein